MSAHLSLNNINTFWASLIVEELFRNGVTYFCVAPGSRSTPLALAAAGHPGVITRVHFDERGLAFHALGYTSGSGKPAAVITTSGTAVANCFPAVIEASKKKLPMIILTADRPPELRATGANQTIDQIKIFGDYARYFFDLPCPSEELSAQSVLTTIDQAVFRARGLPPGPAHLNCMFREPLTPIKAPFARARLLKPLSVWLKSAAPYTTWRAADKVSSAANVKEIAGRLDKIRRGIIVVGKLKNGTQRRAALKLAEKLNWPVFPDITSGLRTATDHPLVFPYFDHLLLDEKSAGQWEIGGVIHLGGRMTSARYYDFIKRAAPREYIMILDHPLRNDPLHVVTLRLEARVSWLCAALAKILPPRREAAWVKKLRKDNQTVHRSLDNFLNARSGATEPGVCRQISELIPGGHGLFLGCSLPVREMDLYASPDGRSVEIGANRGASGIDGTLASAIGFAEGRRRPATVLTGDLAFLYDINSLALLREASFPLTIVIFNNNGGGIFSLLPIAGHPEHFEKMFGTPHDLTFKAAAELFGLRYFQADTSGDFARIYASAAAGKISTIIEVITGRRDNARLQNNWQAQIKKTLKTAPLR
jgi:2-succinyl-5-enolpyruvyl-6-hydroxy-3-cyclohexene-1-carboxylate synthase